MGGGGGFSFPLPDLRANRFFHCQPPAIVVVISMLEVAVVAMAVVIIAGLITLAALLVTLTLDIYLFLDLTPPSIAI